MSDEGKRTLIVTGQKPIANIKNKSGGQSTLYEVYATNVEGAIVEESLRAFTELEEGVPIEYGVERYTHPRYGTSYTLTPPRGNSKKRLRDVEDELERIVMWATKQGYARPEWEAIQRDRREEESKEREEMHHQAHDDSQPDYEEPPPAPPAAVDAAEQQAPQQTEPTPAPERPELDERFGKEAPWNDEDLGKEPAYDQSPKDMELG